MYVYICTYTYVCMYVCIYVCMYACMYVVHIDINTYACVHMCIIVHDARYVPGRRHAQPTPSMEHSSFKKMKVPETFKPQTALSTACRT